MCLEVMAPRIFYLSHCSSTVFLPLCSVSSFLRSEKTASYVSTQESTVRIAVKLYSNALRKLMPSESLKYIPLV